jgi:hypothetical protein
MPIFSENTRLKIFGPVSKYLILLIFALFTVLRLGAQSTSSPYSYFGLGLEQNPGTGVNQVLGGTGIGLRSEKFLNTINPASYCSLDSLSFNFEFGLESRYTLYTDATKTQHLSDANLKYLVMGFKIKPWWATVIGVAPYSSTGYRLDGFGTVEGDADPYSISYKGSGGVTRLFFGNSVRPFRNLSLGVNGSYLFGNIKHEQIAGTNNVIPGFNLTDKYHMNNLLVDFGLQYTAFFGVYNASLGLIWSPTRNLITSHLRTYTTSLDTIEIFSVKTGGFIIPERQGIGFSLKKQDKFTLAFDYSKREWSGTGLEDQLIKTTDARRYSGGIEFNTGRKTGFRKYNPLTFRIGGSWENSYLIVNSKPLYNKSLSVGAGIPLRSELTRVNLSLETGIFGTTGNNLIRENYVLLHINLTLMDRWFVKSKFD